MVKKEFTFVWKVENFSFNKTINGHHIYSPYFIAEDFERTQWRLLLYPKSEDSGGLALFLCRYEEDEGPVSILIDFQLALLSSTTGSPEVKSTNFVRTLPFELNDKRIYNYGEDNMINKHELFGIQKSELLRGDVLTLQCRMWRGEGTVLNVGHAVTRSVVGCDKILFPWQIDNFSSWKEGIKKTTDVSSLFPSDKSVIFNAFLETHLNIVKILIDIIIPADKKCPCVSCWAIYVINASGNRLECVKDHMENAFQKRYSGDHFWTLSFSLTKHDILDNNQLYLHDDALSLLCELTLSDGDIVISELTDIISASEIPKTSEKSEFLKKDLWAMYEEGALNDFTLKTKTKTFSVHSVILCARSSVFRAMITTEMKEKQEKCIIVEDMTDDTVHRLLHFIYCEIVEGLEWETAVNLYFAADEYNIISLRDICSTFLKSNLTIMNVCEALKLSDRHHDEVFKCAVQEFIVKNHNNVLLLDEWEALEENDSKLAIETLRKFVK